MCIATECITTIDEILKITDAELGRVLSRQFVSPEETMRFINGLEGQLANLLANEQAFAARNIEVGGSVENVIDSINTSIFQNDVFGAEVSTAFRGFFADSIRNFANTYINNIDKDLFFNFFSDRTTAFVQDWSQELGRLMQLNSHTEIQRILTRTLEAGEGIPRAIQSLEDSYGFSRLRARRTAITEVLRAHSYARDEAFTQSPAVASVVWRHSGPRGIDPRPHHVAIDGQTVEKGKTFLLVGPNGTFRPRFPRDTILPASEVVECHCTHTPVTDRRITGLTVDEKQILQEEGIREANRLFAS